jgi:malonyl CoA-acyl carrier protein transacylase
MKSNNSVAYLFPGQGSQESGMGRDLFDLFPDLIQRADKVLGYCIRDLCLDSDETRLNQTNYTQPALYIVSTLTYIHRLSETNLRPQFVAGHSLGEYGALFAAEVFDFETGLRLVQKRGELMQRARPGGMAAVIGFNKEQVERVLRENALNTLDIANLNTPTQIVVSGPREVIQSAKETFEQAGMLTYIVLKTGGAFHSRYMEEARLEFSEFLNGFTFFSPRIPVISNVQALPYERARIKENLANQITHSVMWSDSIKYLLDRNIEAFEEIGPGKVLSGLLPII